MITNNTANIAGVNTTRNTANLDTLGFFCGWSMSGPSAQSDVQRVLGKYNLQEDITLPRVGPTSAYRRAVLKAVQGGKRSEREYDVVKLSETDTEITHAIVRKQVEASPSRSEAGELQPSGDVELDVVFTTGFDKARRDALGVNPLDLLRFDEASKESPIAQTIINFYKALAVEYSANDVRTAFQEAFDSWGAFRAIPQGGLWFVPKGVEAKVDAWQGFMRDLGHTPLIIPVFDTRESKEQLAVLATRTLEGQLKDLKAQLVEFQGTGRTLRASTYEDRIDQLKTLQGKSLIYKDLLNSEVDELTELIDAAKSAVWEDLGKLK